MPFISYAQNCEDVLLWRALGHVQNGFFIDVGAHHPDLDSVTRAFSDRGWHGINIEPLPAQAALIRAARPRDITLQVAVGTQNGRVPFHVVAGTGLSTLDGEIARTHAQGGFAVATESVEMLTLATICALHAEPVIHFLKIDVEGAERAVLEGADLQRFRPWIILAEATEPGSPRQIHQDWEPLLLAADYVFQWFDGLNRFYVAAERVAELGAAFATPPNVFDDFVRVGDNSWIARFDNADAEARALREQINSAITGLEQSADRERRHSEHAGHEIARLREAVAGHDAEAALQRLRADTADHMFALRHRDMEELRASRHEARHELQQTHLRLQATELDRDAALHALRHELQQTHLRLQAELARTVDLHPLRHELQNTHLRLQATEQERNAARQHGETVEQRLGAAAAEEQRLVLEQHQLASRLQALAAELGALHAAQQRPRGMRRVARGVSRRLVGLARRAGDFGLTGAPGPAPSASDRTGSEADAAPPEPAATTPAPPAEPDASITPAPLTDPPTAPDPPVTDSAEAGPVHRDQPAGTATGHRDEPAEAASMRQPGPAEAAPPHRNEPGAATSVQRDEPTDAASMHQDGLAEAAPTQRSEPGEATSAHGDEPAAASAGRQDGSAMPAGAPVDAPTAPTDNAPGAPGAAETPVEPAAQPEAPALPISPPPPLVVTDGESDGLRTVHQFHSGSAVGDAITNALLMVRGMLRRMGYHSEIFVEQPPPALAHELRTIDELPRHDGYVLLMHHSMGYDRFEQVLALPARKLLIYHNITPPELLNRHPHMAHYAALGRTQLARFRGRVAAALAISAFNGAELQRLGLAPVRTCTLLFDIEALRRRAADAAPVAATLRREGVFTVLFVGRIAESKNQAALIEAFAVFRARYHDRHRTPARLVLVGRADAPDDPYAALLRRRIEACGLGEAVLLTGGVSDAVLDGWYGAADLYVSLSRHEGFGVPLVEAMVHGVPVLAFGAGAVPSTLAGAATLVRDLSPDAVAEQMLALAGDTALRDAQRLNQFGSLDRFGLQRQAVVLQDALLRAGAALPEDTEARSRFGEAGLTDALRFSVTGHVNGSYSLAAINRDLALALDAARPGHVRLLPVEGTPTLDLSGVPAGQDAAIRALALRPPHETGPELVISQHYPVLPPREGADLAVALVFWEESRLPAGTVSVLARHFDAVVAPTRFVREALIESGLPVPVRVIPPALRLDRFLALGAARPDTTPAVHRFLHVSSCFPRKGVDILLRAWASAFRSGDPVSLVIKGFPNPHNEVAAQLDALRAADPLIAPITLLDGDLDEDALLVLYADADTMVLPTRGEGLNLPAAEALAAGLGLIVTGAGGHMDFCADPADPDRVLDGVRLLRFDTAPSGSHLATPHSVWLEPDQADLVSALRERAGSAAMRVRPPVLAGPDAIARAYTALVADLLRTGPRRPVRMSWVSSWGIRCGVAEYSRQMLAAIGRDPDAAALRIRVLADRRTPVNSDDADAAWPCWNAGNLATLPPLAAAIAADDADVVMLQHQTGLLSFAVLADLLHHPSLRGRVVMATLHNTVDLISLEQETLSRVLDGLGRIARVLVHTVADLQRLREMGLRERVTLLPHGVPPALPVAEIRALSPDGSAPLIGCYGFFLPGKGIDALIEAVALLRRRRWPDAGLRLVNAEYGADESAREISRCRALAEALGVAEAIAFETGFLPNRFSLDRLAECDVVVLAHRPSREASSAALRGAMAASVPVAVTPVSLFDEAEDAAFRFDGLDAQSIADGLDRLLADQAARVQLQQAGQYWIAARQWGSVARQVAGMATGLVRTARLEPSG